jgi:hypothetical protein
LRKHEEKYVVYMGTEEHVLRVHELLGGSEPWPERFRTQIPASAEGQATTVYGSKGRDGCAADSRRMGETASAYFYATSELSI